MTGVAVTAEPLIRTVLGDIDPVLLGPTNYHEHLFQATPLLPGDELDDEAASGAEAALLHDSGFTAMVDATPLGLGREPEALARISSSTGLHVIATTGRHREAHYSDQHPMQGWTAARLTTLFVSDITTGIAVDDTEVLRSRGVRTARTPGGSAVRAGMLKAGIDYWRISPFERTTLEAVAAAHRATLAPIMVHLELCTAAHEVLDLLAAEGVASDRVVLAHADRDPDPGLHTSLADRGAYLGYDGFARPRTRSDAELLVLTEKVVAAGGGDRILLGGDVARRTRFISYGGMPGLAYLGQRYIPRLRDTVGGDAVDRMLVANPVRWLALG